MPLLTRSPCQGEMDIDQGSREVRDLCCGHNYAVDPRHPGTPPHHWRVDDASGECVEWDLLWVGSNDVVIVETIIVSMQVASEP